MGSLLADTADGRGNWYFFQISGSQKISTVLEPPAESDYDIYLYEFHEDGTLTLVFYSNYVGDSMENLSCVGNAGYYFLRVVPVTPAGFQYNFMIDLIGSYDENEPDDNPSFSTPYVNCMDVENTIDNLFDQDWMKLTVESTAAYEIELKNVPAGRQYSVVVYDSSLNYRQGIVSDGNKTVALALEPGTYYFCVESYNSQFEQANKYQLKATPRHEANSASYTTEGGNLVEITTNRMYINGRPVNMN